MSWPDVFGLAVILLFLGWAAWVERLGNFCTCHQKPRPKEAPPPPEPRIPHLWESRREWGEKPTPEEHGELPQPEPMTATDAIYMMKQGSRQSGHTLDVDPPPERGPGWARYQDEGPGS